MLRTAIGLIGLGLIGGVVPTGVQGITYALQVLAGTAGALTALVICCLAGAVATRRAAASVPRPAPRPQRSPIASRRSAPGSI